MPRFEARQQDDEALVLELYQQIGAPSGREDHGRPLASGVYLYRLVTEEQQRAS